MPQTIKPFKATYYNPSRFKDYSRLASPPYDVINQAQLKKLRKKSPYNFSRVLIADNGNYKAAASRLNSWLKQQVLVDDKTDSLYLYEQSFKAQGKTFRRFGIFSLLKMDKKGIFPHEYTHSAPKKDRRKVIEITKANMGPIFVIATKKLPKLAKVYKAQRSKKVIFSCKDGSGAFNKVWKISDKAKIAAICQEVSDSKIVIADGHHRFETSFDYFKRNKNRFKDLNYVLTYIVGPQEGLVILPTHRIIDNKKSTSLILDRLKKYFTIKKVTKLVLEKKLQSKGKFCFGIYHQNKFFFLDLKDRRLLDKIPNKLYRQLDTYVFHKAVLPMLKLDSQMNYSHSVSEAKTIASRGRIAFLLRAASLDKILEISSKGFRLPQKSTYFYPKILSGLVIRRFGV